MSFLATPYGLLLIAFATAFFWRVLGAALAGRVEADTPLFDWCVCVTQAIVGGLMIRAVLLPSSGLAQVPLVERVIAISVGIAVFLLIRGRVLPGVIAGVATLAAMIAWRGL